MVHGILPEMRLHFIQHSMVAVTVKAFKATLAPRSTAASVMFLNEFTQYSRTHRKQPSHSTQKLRLPRVHFFVLLLLPFRLQTSAATFTCLIDQRSGKLARGCKHGISPHTQALWPDLRHLLQFCDPEDQA